MRAAFTLAAAAAVMGALAAPAGSASGAPNGSGSGDPNGSVQNTINYWEQQGYTVNIDRVGSGPLNSCVVTSVRNPNTITQLYRENGRGPGPSFLVPVIISRTVQVSLFCAG
jgi:hypothetical protein